LFSLKVLQMGLNPEKTHSVVSSSVHAEPGLCQKELCKENARANKNNHPAYLYVFKEFFILK